MKNILYMAATVLLCTSCFHVNSNYKGSFKFGGKDAIKGEGTVVTKSFDDLTGFDQIVVNGGSDAVFTQGETFNVTLRTQENVFDHLDYRVEGTKLILETKNKVGIRAEEFDLTIQAPMLKGITVNGASDFDIKGGMVSEEDFDIEINGAGDFDFDSVRCRDFSIRVNGAADMDLDNVDVQKLKVEINGAGDVVIGGKAVDASLAVNGAGGIDARELKVSGNVNKRAAGIAKIQL